MKLKKIGTLALAMAMVLSLGSTQIVKAADSAPQESGTYTADIDMYKDGSSDLSMCANFFAAEAKISISGENATITAYVVNPVPAFPKESNGNYSSPLKDVVLDIDGNDYDATVGTSTVTKEFDKTGMSGVQIGESYPCSPITVTVPKTALLDSHIDVSAYVAVVMNTDVDFDMELTNYRKSSGETSGSVESSSSKKTSTVTATVPENSSSYTVTVPQTVDLGELSAEEDTMKEFEVKVNIEKGNDDKTVTVSIDNEGDLIAGDEKIKFQNDFGTHEFEKSATKTGTLTVKHEEVAGVKAASYTGTLTFNISAK